MSVRSAQASKEDSAAAKTTSTDTELVLQCQQGNQQSFRQLYRRYQQRVRSTIYQLCGAYALDDLVQEVFLRVWKGLPKLRQPSQFSTWLYRICWNVASDQRGKLQRQRAFNLQLPEDTADLPLKNAKSSYTPDLMQLHYQDIIQQGMQQLSLNHRAVLVLHDLEDLPQKEVAKILGIALGTVKSRLFHARTSLRKYIIQQQGEMP
ncbi:MAG: sigma-70 family RNA polymerase sigma factor [Moorea sp. SIO1G6]|uniref:sigma-70 family RNA polymerase sigma factor n=1 Tax=Moorena producens TaxID=1155739 RepID=UPI0003003828|nr:MULTISPECIES: sigma-70 family RNA polymerase sigma factor [unclassified Moorena]NEQ14848.1 sigma-70 family RNA polymerase sigma factor [Moorena sp. SIO3E2]NES84767.1 sigma-70 family RNA polymerase sigma factor [Moorena sp. SIO2B7]OLT69150.1 RNA polymerase subunit sigma [Moorena producens 3L]NEP32526.1 sigma-70 family RNA polymerase sigma factor [Moorena sp. SIO3B2]NEP64565.1 sigma-70 family RNA polymerase sigma factor [Moorena sp. SIO3A5]